MRDCFSVKSGLQILSFTGLISLGAQIRIPIGETPIVMTTAFIYLAGLLLGSNKAFAATACYVLLGVVGIPVFSGGHSGFNHFFGPTGGYLVGFVLSAWFIGGISSKFNTMRADFFALLVGSLCIHTFGIAWMNYSYPESWEATRAIYGIYLTADAIKILFVLWLTPWLRAKALT